MGATISNELKRNEIVTIEIPQRERESVNSIPKEGACQTLG